MFTFLFRFSSFEFTPKNWKDKKNKQWIHCKMDENENKDTKRTSLVNNLYSITLYLKIKWISPLTVNCVCLYQSPLGRQVSQSADSRLNLRLSFLLINILPLTEGHNRLEYSRFSTPDRAQGLSANIWQLTTTCK